MTVVRVLRHGQITLPKNLREVLDIKEGDILEIGLEQSCLVLRAKMLVDKAHPAPPEKSPGLLPVASEWPPAPPPAGQGRAPHD